VAWPGVWGGAGWCGGVGWYAQNFLNPDFRSGHLQVFFAIVMSAMGVAQSAGLAPDVVTVQTAVNSIFRILDRQSAIDPEAPGKTVGEPQGCVELRDVHLFLPPAPDIKIFQGLTLTHSPRARCGTAL